MHKATASKRKFIKFFLIFICNTQTIVANSPHKQIKELNSSVVSFLKSTVLRKEDISVFEHGLNFGPSLKN